MKPVRLISGFLTVGVWTLASRILGFVRDAIILAYLGTGPAYEAYVVAFRLPNMFRRFFAEGAFNMAFIPIFSKKLEGDEDAEGFAAQAFAGLASILILLTLAAQAAMPWLIYGLASGFAGQEQFDLSVDFGRIAFPYILFISLAALLSGILNSLGRFAAAAAAPVLLNVMVVSVMVIAALTGGDIARALIWTIPVAGVAQLVLVWVAARRAGFVLRIERPRLTPDMRRLIKVAIPAALAGGVVQVNLLVGQQVASYFDRAVGWLYAADRLYQLPLGVVGIAIGVVLLPDLSRRLKADDHDGARNALSRAAEVSLALTIPAAVALIVIPLPLVSVLFERGATTADDSAAIALAVAVYGLGLPAFVIQKILQPLFFAREDTRTPVKVAAAAVVLNLVLNLILMQYLAHVGLALATAISSWMNALVLARLLGRSGAFYLDARNRKRLPRILLAAILMGGMLYGARRLIESEAFPLEFTGLAGIVPLIGLIALALGVYFGTATLFGALRFSELKASLRRRGAGV